MRIEIGTQQKKSTRFRECLKRNNLSLGELRCTTCSLQTVLNQFFLLFPVFSMASAFCLAVFPYELAHQLSRFFFAIYAENLVYYRCQFPRLIVLHLGVNVHTHYDVLPHRVFVGVVEDFGWLLMQQPVPVFILLGFHFLIKASVVIYFVHSEHLLQNRNSRLISFENQAAMYVIYSDVKTMRRMQSGGINSYRYYP